MERSTYQKIYQGEIKGWVREDILELLPSPFFEDPVSFIRQTKGKVIKESRVRFAAIVTFTNRRRVFIKRDITKGSLETLKYLLLPTKARKEWFIACQLQERDLPIPQPFGWMQKVHWGFVKEGYYLSEAIGSGLSLIEDLSVLRESTWINELAKTVRKIHNAGLFHKDLHAGNFIRNDQMFFLTDLHRAKIVSALSLNQRLWNLSLLFHSLRPIWKESEHLRFIEKYFEGTPFYLQKKEELLQRIYSFMSRLQKKQWRSRTKRCLTESTEFSILKERGIRYYHRRDFAINHLKKMIGEHLRLGKENPSALVKQSSEIFVSILNDGRNRICVKQLRYPHFFNSFKEHFRRSKGMRAWISGNGLRARGFPTLKPLGLAEERGWLGLKETFFFMGVLEEAQELDRYLSNGFEDSKEKRLFINVFAQWLCHFHETGLYHKDMKTCNILVSKNGETWNFYLLDLEDVRLNKKLSEKDLFRSFLQLNTSTPTVMTWTDRFRFFREYLGKNPIIRNRKTFLKRLIDESKKRGLVYVSPQGVVIEKM